MTLRDLLKNRIILSTLAIYSFFALALVAFSFSGGGGMPEEFEAPQFSLDDVFGGGDVALSAHSGKPVIIYFYASW